MIGALHTDKQMSDTIPIFTKSITKTNVNDNYLTKFQVPFAYKVHDMNCVDLDCNGFVNQLISDFDGTLTGDGTGRGAIFANPEYIWGVENVPQKLNYRRVPVVARLDESDNVLNTEAELAPYMPNKGRPKNNACTFSSNMNAHVCTGADAYNYNIITLTNHDFDVSGRRIGPLSVITNRGPNGNVDIINSNPRDDGSLWGLSTGIYKAVVALGTEVEFYLASTPPQLMRLQMEGGDFFGHHSRDDRKVLMKFYNPVPQVLKLATLPAEQTLPLQPVEKTMLERKPTIKDEPGSYYHDRDEQMLYIVFADNKEVYEITVSDQIAMSFGIPPVPLEDFYADNLVNNIAGFLGIPADRIKVTAIVSESSRKKRSTDQVIERIDVEITLDESNQEEVDSVHAVNDQMSTDAQLGDNSAANALLDGATETPVEVQSIAVVTKPKTPEAQAKYAATNDKLIAESTTGKISTADILASNVVVQITDMQISESDLTIDCSNGGAAVEIPAVDLTFYDQNGQEANAGTISKQWIITLEGLGDEAINFNGDLMEPVINSGASFDSLTVNCDAFRYRSAATTLNLAFRVTDPVNANFVQNLNLVVAPLVIADMSITTEPQTIDCSVGSVMRLEDLTIEFTDSAGNQIYVGSDAEPWTFELTFSSNSEDFISASGLWNTTVANAPVVFEDLKVDCSNFQSSFGTNMVDMIVSVENPQTGETLTAEYELGLQGEAGATYENNWQQRMQLLWPDKTIRLLNDHRLCAQVFNEGGLGVRVGPYFYSFCGQEMT